MQTRRRTLGATPISSRAERTPAADWRTPRPHRFADRTPSTATSMSFKCPSSVSDSKLPFMGGAVQPISIGIMGFGSPWKGPPAPPDMRAPLCLSQAGLPSVTQKGVSPPSSLLFLSSSLFSSPSSVSDFTSTRTYKDHSQLTPVLILPSPQPDSHHSKPVLLFVLFVFSTTTDISLCCIVTVSFYIQSSNSSRTCNFLFSFPLLISLCFLRVPVRGSWKQKHPVWSPSTHYLPLDFSPFPRIGFAFAVLSSFLSSKA